MSHFLTSSPEGPAVRPTRSRSRRGEPRGIRSPGRTPLIFGVFILIVTAALAQQVSKQDGWLKGSVRELDEPARSTFLSFLDEGRKRSDAIAAALASDDRGSIASLVTAEVMSGWNRIEGVLRQHNGGARPNLTYRNQAIEIRSENGKRVMTSRVWYVLGDPSARPPRNFMAVVVAEESGHAGRAIYIDFLPYPGDVPTWLLQVDGPVLRTTPKG